MLPGADREQPAEDTDGADHQGHTVCHHRHLCTWHAGDEELHEGEGEEEGGAEECSSSSDIQWRGVQRGEEGGCGVILMLVIPRIMKGLILLMKMMIWKSFLEFQGRIQR